MKILKFGGSSVGNAERINSVINILSDYLQRKENIAVVFSAFQGVTAYPTTYGKETISSRKR